MANRFTQYSPQEFTSLYADIPYQQIAAVGEHLDKRYDEGQRQLSEFEQLLNVPALEQDTPIKKERIKYYEDQLNSSLDSVKGDYSRVIPAITRLKRELGKDLREGPLGAVVTNYSTDAESKKRLNELVDKKLIDVNTAEKLYKMDRSKYQGIGSQNSLGRFNNFNTTTPAEQIDLAEHFDKLAQGYKADKVASGGYRFSKDGKYIIKTDGSNEVVSDKQIASDLMRVAESDPKIQAFVQQQTMLDTYDIKGQEYQNQNGDPSYYQIGNSAYPSKQDFQQLYSQELLNSPISFAASKHGYQSTSSDYDIKSDDYARDKAKEDLNNISRFSMQGVGINPGTLPKTASDLTNNIAKLSTHNDQLRAELQHITPGSPEANTIEAQIAWNTMLLQKQAHIQAEAEKFSTQKTSEQDKKMFAKFGQWNPGDLSDGNYARILKEKGLPSTATVKEVMQAMGSKDPIQDAKRLSAAYNRKSEISDKYLQEQAKNFTIQPSLITLDSKSTQPNSKALNEIYNSGQGAWQVFDENGPILDPKDYPKTLNFTQITEQPVDELGHLFAASSVPDKDSGEEAKKYYVRPQGANNINEKIGLNLIQENQPSSYSDKGNPQFRSSDERARYTCGLSMINPTYSNQVAQLKTGETQDLLNGPNIVGKISKEQTAHGIIYKLTAVDGRDGTFGSVEEVLQVLNKLK